MYHDIRPFLRFHICWAITRQVTESQNFLSMVKGYSFFFFSGHVCDSVAVVSYTNKCGWVVDEMDFGSVSVFFFHLWNRKLPEVSPQLLLLVKKSVFSFIIAPNTHNLSFKLSN